MEGLATAVIQCSVDRLFNMVEYHVGVETRFKEQLEEMRKHLDLMRSYLADTATLQTKKEVLKTSLKLLKELMDEADDLLTDCSLHTKKLSSERLMTPFFKYDMAEKLKDLNVRMKDTESAMARYLTASPNPEGNISEYRDKKMFSSQNFNSSGIIGLEDDLTKIREWILSKENDLNRIGIVGMGGLGKTTIAQKVFNHNEVVAHFEERIWLSVSQSFKGKDMLSSILRQLGKDGSLGLDESQMFHKIYESLRDKSYLIILDDVWDADLEWWRKVCSDMPIPAKDDSKSGCIIVTTRNKDIVVRMGVNRAHIHEPKVLDKDDSWSLFCKYAFCRTKGECLELYYKEVGMRIADKCGGLPLAIKTIGALLASKTLRSEWADVEANFRGGLAESTRNPIMASLQLSYAELPSLLKQCLLSFAIYPEDAEVEAEQVIYWWLGEGLIQPGKNNSRTAIEYGYAFMTELPRRCLIEVTSCRGHDGRVFTFKVHDLVRTLITLMAEEEELCCFDEKGNQKLTLEGTRWLGLKDPIDKYSLSVMKKIRDPKLRALLLVPSSSSSNHNFDVTKIFEMSIKSMSEYRDLKLMGLLPAPSSNHNSYINNILELQLKSLRVLDLSHSEMKLSDDTVLNEFWAWITSLERLAYLNLRGLANLRMLPKSIKKLRNLQLLVLRGCNNVCELHSSVANLKQLIILDVGACPELQNMPRGIQNLSNLQELSGFRLSNKSFLRLINLQELVNLRVLRIDVHEESVISKEAEELSVLSKLVKLRVLSISYDYKYSQKFKLQFKDQHVVSMLDRISPPPDLQELYLKNYRKERLWSWINPDKLSALRYLSIEDGNLVSLSLDRSKPDQRNRWKIEGLCLKDLRRFVDKWERLKEDMPLIHSLEVSNCIGLQGTPCNGHGHWNKNQSP